MDENAKKCVNYQPISKDVEMIEAEINAENNDANNNQGTSSVNKQTEEHEDTAGRLRSAGKKVLMV